MTKITDAVVLLEMNFKPDATVWREVARKVASSAASAKPASTSSTPSSAGAEPADTARRETK